MKMIISLFINDTHMLFKFYKLLCAKPTIYKIGVKKKKMLKFSNKSEEKFKIGRLPDKIK